MSACIFLWFAQTDVFGVMNDSVRANQRKMQADIARAEINMKRFRSIKKRVKKVFKGVKDARASTIARTETTRFYNEGKINSYKESGIEMNKEWVIYHLEEALKEI